MIIIQSLETVFAFGFDCSSLGLMLGIIAFLLCLALEGCSFLRLLLFVSDLYVALTIIPLLF